MQTTGNRHANTSQQSYSRHALPIAVFSSGHPLFFTNCYQLTDPRGMGGLVDESALGIKPRMPVARDFTHLATQTDNYMDSSPYS